MNEVQLSTEASPTVGVPESNAVNQLIPGAKAEIVPYQEASPEKQQNIQQLLSEIDMNDTHSIIFFRQQGSGATYQHL